MNANVKSEHAHQALDLIIIFVIVFVLKKNANMDIISTDKLVSVNAKRNNVKKDTSSTKPAVLANVKFTIVR